MTTTYSDESGPVMRKEIEKLIEMGLDFYLYAGSELAGIKVKVSNIRALDERFIRFEAFDKTYIVSLNHIYAVHVNTNYLTSKGTQ